jgi:hypothetical protein
MSVLRTHEFDGSETARANGAEIVRRRWSDVKPGLLVNLRSWFEEEFIAAAARTPKDSEFLSSPTQVRILLKTPPAKGKMSTGRLGAMASPGERWDDIVIVDIWDPYVLWFHLVDRPQWYYKMSGRAFHERDPFVGEVTRQVADKTQFAQYLMPGLLSIAGFTLGFSARIGLVIAGIVLEELSEEMTRDIEGKEARSPLEILKSAGISLFIDRVTNKAFGGAGKALDEGAALPAKLEKAADLSAPAVRRELIAGERPLVESALREGTARQVTDPALRAEGYTAEVLIDVDGAEHIYRLAKDGTWCRFSKRLCNLDLGADVAREVKKARSFTQSKLGDLRERLGTIRDEIDFLRRISDRMRAKGKMDLSLLNPQERMLLDELAPTGDAADLTRRELDGLSKKRGLEYKTGLEVEERLVEQLIREGRPLYDVMRAASPSSVVRSKVRSSARGLDAVTGVAPRSGNLQVDHVVPVRTIVDLPGFDKLRYDDQLAIVNDVTNLRAVDAIANGSRNDRSWSEWPQARLFYDDVALAEMRRLEAELEVYLTERIASLLRRR